MSLLIIAYTFVVIVLVLAIHRNFTRKKPSSNRNISLDANFPIIVCLCGSTKFYKEFQHWNYILTMRGKIVLSVGFYAHATEEAHGEHIGCTEEDKIKLDALHKRKIDLADEVFVINLGGYIGESTRSEIEYANKNGKFVTYLEPNQTIK